MSPHEKLIQHTMDIQRQITRAGLTRRDLLKMGLLSAGSGLLLPISGLSMRATWAGGGSCPQPGKNIISPPTRPWKDEMPKLVEKQTVLDNNPSNISIGKGGGAPGSNPVGTLTGGDSKVRLKHEFPDLFLPFPQGATPFSFSHQAWGKSTPLLGNHPPQQWYELHAKQFTHHWHSELNGFTGNQAWGFDGLFPGPMFRTRYGVSHFVRIHNDLPSRNPGFGINQITTHLHNMHTPAESNGNPLFTNYPGHYWDYHYPNVYAGVNQFGGIASDGNLLPAPVVVQSFKQTVGERFDIILDFSNYQPEQEIILVNRAEQVSGRGPTGALLNPGFEVLKFIVTSDTVRDNSVIPTKLRDLPNTNQAVSQKRSWKFDRSGGEWTVNNEPYNRDVISATIAEGSAERWTLVNNGGSWTHPIHMHYEVAPDIDLQPSLAPQSECTARNWA